MFIIRFFKRIFYLIRYLSWIDPEIKIGKNCKIGPLAHIRKGVVLRDNVFIGNFVEIKNSTIGKNTKIKHYAYIGDAEIGKNVNIGAGTIIVNSDGEKKHKTAIEDGAFVGVNNSLVAPVRIGKNAYTAAGSVITDDVPPDSLAIARAPQVDKINWVKDKREFREKNLANLKRVQKEIKKSLAKKGHYEKQKMDLKKKERKWKKK